MSGSNVNALLTDFLWPTTVSPKALSLNYIATSRNVKYIGLLEIRRFPDYLVIFSTFIKLTIVMASNSSDRLYMTAVLPDMLTKFPPCRIAGQIWRIRKLNFTVLSFFMQSEPFTPKLYRFDAPAFATLYKRYINHSSLIPYGMKQHYIYQHALEVLVHKKPINAHLQLSSESLTTTTCQ